MSKTRKGKQSGGDVSSKSSNNSSSSKDSQKRPSVFERLGTKTSGSQLTSCLSVNTISSSDVCRHWAQNGTCPYGKSCKLSGSHILISPSKRNSKKESEKQPSATRDDKRILSTVVRKSPDVNWESWDQTELEYEDEKALEKRRQLLQMELELQMKKETRKQEIVKRRSSSTSSCSSTSSSGSSSSESSSTSSVDTRKRTTKKKRQSTSSPSSAERNSKKRSASRTKAYKESPPRRIVKKGSSPGKVSLRRKQSSSPPPRRLPSPSPKQKSFPSKETRRKESPRGVRCSSKHRSDSRERRPRGRSPPRHRSRPRSPRPRSNRPRSTDRKKDDDRGRKDDIRRKPDYRDKRDYEEIRNREKAREAAREKERMEALERCRERQREREQLAKEKERAAREEREREKLREAERERERKEREYERELREKNKDRERMKDRGRKSREKLLPDKKDRDKDSSGRYERGRSYDRVSIDKERRGLEPRKSVERERERERPRSSRERERYERPFERRLIPDEKPYSSPYRGSDRPRYDAERERIVYKDLSPSRDESRLRISSQYPDDRRLRRDRAWEGRYEEGASKEPRRDWESREYPDSRRDWDTRSRRGHEENEDEWYGGSGASEWHRSRGDHNLVVVRDSSSQDDRRHTEDKDSVEAHTPPEPETTKRSRDDEDSIGGDAKRARTEESQGNAALGVSLEEELSDISDGPDEILNREDTEDPFLDDNAGQDGAGSETGGDVMALIEPSQPSCPSINIEQRLLEGRIPEEEGIDNLDFEEISDEELIEEECKSNKATLGDALGVDWASLISECRPQKRNLDDSPGSALRLWDTKNILRRIGVSEELAGPKMFSEIKESLKETGETFLSPIAGAHRTLREKLERRKNLLTGPFTTRKRALSARTDIAIRRELCGLPVVSLESQPSVGLCQWVI